MNGMLNRVSGNSPSLLNHLHILQTKTQAPVQANKRHCTASWQQKKERSVGGGVAVGGDQCHYSAEPTSVLDIRSPSPTSTLSSSFGGSSESGAVAAVSGLFCEAVSDGQRPDPLLDSKDQQPPTSAAAPPVAPPAFSSSSSSGGGGGGTGPWYSSKTNSNNNRGSNWRLSTGNESRGAENKPEAFVKEDQCQSLGQGQGNQQTGRAEEWVPALGEFQSCGAANAAASAGMEDLESMLLLESATPAPDQSIMRWLLGESDDLKDLPPAALPHIKGGPAHFEDAMDSNFADPGGFAFPTNSFGGDVVVAPPSTPSLLHPHPNLSTFCPPYPTLSPLPRLNNTSHLGSVLHTAPPPPPPPPPPPLTFAPSVSAFQHHESAEPPHVLYGSPPTSTFFKDPSHNSAPPHSSNNIFFPVSYDMPMNPTTPPTPKRLYGVIPPPPLLWQPQVSIPVVKQEFMFKPQHPDIFRRQQQQQQVLLSQFQRAKGSGGGGAGILSNNVMKPGSEELQQAILGQLFKAAEALELGTFSHAQAILARLNQHLSPLGKPLERAAFYFKEALVSRITNTNSTSCHTLSPMEIVHKISAYKYFSEVSPVSQFANFTATQALLESLEGADSIHIIDMEIGLGGQWASFLKELTLRMGGPPSLRITALGSHDSVELHLARENLHHFAKELNIKFEFNVLDFDGRIENLSLPMLHLREGEVVAVNLSLGMQRFMAGFPSADSVMGFLRLLKELSPKALVVVDHENDRPPNSVSGGSFVQHLWESLQFYSYLFDSLEAVSMNMDGVHKIEKFLMAPKIEGLVFAGSSPPKGMAMAEKLPPWGSLFAAAGFTPMPFSNFTETQAEYLVRRLPNRGFDVVKDHTTLLLGWQGRPLVSASLWRC